MIMKIVDLSIVIVGLLFCIILFYRFPRLSKKQNGQEEAGFLLSVIIPVRNEEKNIANLLSDLKKQTIAQFEVIVVDDMSTDHTYEVAKSFDVNVVKIEDKPDDWLGKSWACQKGAEAARGQMLLFLDADIRLLEDSLQKLVDTQQEVNTTISVQPYHKTEKFYEQFSAIFNIVQTAANGVTLPWNNTLGLFGPVILITKKDYQKIGGHESVKKNIAEDIALGKQLKKAGLKFHLYVSKGDISYRMYSGGFKDLFHGWTKNIALGASSMAIVPFLLIFTFITSLLSTPSHIVMYAIDFDLWWLLIYCGLYLVWVIVLFVLTHKVGKFHPLGIILFPIIVIFFTAVFVISFFIKIFKLKYKWKGRSISEKN